MLWKWRLEWNKTCVVVDGNHALLWAPEKDSQADMRGEEINVREGKVEFQAPEWLTKKLKVPYLPALM